MTVRRLIGYVPQQLSAEGALTGRENAMLFARLFDVPRADRTRAWTAALEATGMLEHADRMVVDLLRRHGPPARTRPGAREPPARC